MRLLITTDDVGGVWNYSATLVKRLAAEGHAILLAIIGDPSGELLETLPENVVIASRRARLEWMTGAETDLASTAQWLTSLSRAWGADVAHLNQLTYTALAMFPAPTVVVAHSDVCSWFSEVRGVEAPDEWAAYRRLVAAGLGAATQVVAPSTYQARLVERHYGGVRVRVIHNGVECGGEVSEKSIDAPAAVITAGRGWDEAKGLRILDDALVELGDDAPIVHHLGPTSGFGAQWTPARVACHGAVPSAEMAAWMRDATIYVASSLYEPFGLAPLEAARTGCALLMSDIGSFRELWDECAVFYAARSPDRLAATLRDLISDRSRVHEVGTAARKRAGELFNADRFAGDYLDLYRDLAARSSRGTRHSELATTGLWS